MTCVVIRGDGIAAYCCAHLLNRAGFPVILEPVDRPRLPAIMLSEQALALIRDVFDRPDLFQNFPRIERRVVAWGPSAKPVSLDHSAVVVSEELLLDSLRPTLAVVDKRATAAPDWNIYASRPLPAPTAEHRFGARTASVVPVSLPEESRPPTCWIESLENGWLFLIPSTPASAWLLAVGDAPEALLARSRVVAGQIARRGAQAGEFPSYPRIVSPLCGPAWLACGTAAMAFDPICGDGTAHAIREAILASAVIRAVARDGPSEGLLSHYQARLTAGFKRHLVLCRDFYRSGACGPWWDSELEAIERGIHWADEALGTHLEFRYQLRGFELHAIR